MYWSNLHYIQNPALRIAEQKNILMSQIESAKQAQKDRHHYELLSFQNDKLIAEQRLGLRKLDDEMQKHLDNLRMQQQQMENQFKIAENQSATQIKITEMNNNTTLTNTMFSHFAVMGQQNNQAMWNMLGKVLDDILQENAHKRQMEAMRFSSELELIKLEMIQNHERKVIVLNHNLLLVEKRLDSDLKREELDFDKYSTVFYKLLEQVLGLSEANTKIDEEAIDKYTDDLFYQMYGERALNNR